MSNSFRNLPRASAEDPGFRLTLDRVLDFAGRYRWVMAGVFVVTAISAYGGLSLMTDLYEARASLLVKVGRENLDAPATARNTVFSTGVRREELGSEVQILRSADLLQQTVDTIGPEAFKPVRVAPESLIGKVKFYVKGGIRWVRDQYYEGLIALDLKKRLNDREQAIAYLDRQLSAEPEKDTDVITLRLRMADPALAVKVQETLILGYFVRRLAVRRSDGVKEFFDRETATLRERLTEAETRVNEWKQTKALTLPAEQKALLLRQIRELSAHQDTAVSERQSLQRQITTAVQMTATRQDTIRTTQTEMANTASHQIRERLAKLESERQRLLATYQAGAQPVEVISEEIEGLRTLLSQQDVTELGSVTTQINPLKQQLEQGLQDQRLRLAGIDAAASQQARALARLQAELGTIEEADAVLTDMERERAVLEESYLAAVKRQKDADVANALDQSRVSNVSVAMPPSATLEPVYPRKLLIMGLALLVGLVLGVALSLAIEWSSEVTRDAASIESATQLDCLGSFGGGEDRAVRGKVIGWR